MKVVLVLVSSVNGYLTKGVSRVVTEWSSKEDAALFARFLAKQKIIVMGSGTYEAAKKHLQIRPGQLRIVCTKNPKAYARDAIPGVLEFSSLTPVQLIKHCAAQGATQIALVGGASLNRSFFVANLVDELRLTIEPVLFGSGKPLVLPGKFNTEFVLVSKKQINKRGTLHLVYAKK